MDAEGKPTAISATIDLLVMDHVIIWPSPSPLRILPGSIIPFRLQQILLNGTFVSLPEQEANNYSWRVRSSLYRQPEPQRASTFQRGTSLEMMQSTTV